jgi:signal transduction histidine kinase
MKSLRTRLLAGMIGSFALLLIVFGLIMDASIEYMLVREFDFYLETLAKTLAAATRADEQGVSVKLVPEALPDIPMVEGELFSQYRADDGTVLAKSANLGAEDLPEPNAEAGGSQVRPFVLRDGRGARVASVVFTVRPSTPPASGSGVAPTGDGTILAVAVARDTTDLESHIRQIRRLLLTSGAVTMGVGGLAVVFVIRRSLRPLGQVAARIAALKEEDLSSRIPATGMPEEITPLVDRLNELLHRLEEAFDRERSLTADAAHELRTPIAGILTTAGVILSSERTPSDYREALEEIRGMARRMGSMVEKLLTLARFDSGRAPLTWEPIEFRQMVAQTWQAWAKEAELRGLTFDNEVPEDLACTSDRAALGIILSNLLENAVQYVNEGGSIRATARGVGGRTEMAVSNTGCMLTEDQVGRVFDRFWRADPSREDTNLHAGLGLPLVRRIAESLGGTATATVDPTRVFTVCVAWTSRTV